VISRIWKILTPVLISIEEEVVINILPLMVQVKSEEQLQDPEMGSSGGLPSASSLMLETGSLYSSFSWTGVPDEADCWSQVTAAVSTVFSAHLFYQCCGSGSVGSICFCASRVIAEPYQDPAFNLKQIQACHYTKS
jgi:hypothetical protein